MSCLETLYSDLIHDSGKATFCLIEQKILSFASVQMTNETPNIFALVPMAQSTSFFGFAEFVTALGVLAAMYSITDVRYKFRLSISALPIIGLAFSSFGLIGILSLAISLWSSENWPIPMMFSNRGYWDAALGAIFLVTIFLVMSIAFIFPPVFNRINYKKFFQRIGHHILQGIESDVPIIAHELARSAKSIIFFAKISTLQKTNYKARNDITAYAKHLLLLIGNKKFCHYVITRSPITAIAFFEEASKQKAYGLPLAQFGRNLIDEAVRNKGCILYHEDEGYYSGLLAYQKPFSRALCGDYDLVEATAQNGISILELPYQRRISLDAEQIKAYCQLLTVFVKAYLAQPHSTGGYIHSYALVRTLNDLHQFCSNLYKIGDPNYPQDLKDEIEHKLSEVMGFITHIMRTLDKTPNVTIGHLKGRSEQRISGNIHDLIANLIFEIICDASQIKGSDFTVWHIFYSEIWSKIFIYAQSETNASTQAIRYKLCRLIADEIKRSEKFFNYKSAKVLGFCLYVMGTKARPESGINKSYRALHRAILHWTKKNFLRLYNKNPEVAEAALVGTLSFDKENSQLVKIYEKGLNRTAPEERLQLI